SSCLLDKANEAAPASSSQRNLSNAFIAVNNDDNASDDKEVKSAEEAGMNDGGRTHDDKDLEKNGIRTRGRCFASRHSTFGSKYCQPRREW
ncbi:hypothetical protein L917_15779, partial [Phytophthora nicotianae]